MGVDCESLRINKQLVFNPLGLKPLCWLKKGHSRNETVPGLSPTACRQAAIFISKPFCRDLGEGVHPVVG
jgi:hypothetical protein